MTELKKLQKSGLSRKEAKAWKHDGEVYRKELKKMIDRDKSKGEDK